MQTNQSKKGNPQKKGRNLIFPPRCLRLRQGKNPVFWAGLISIKKTLLNLSWAIFWRK